MSRILLTAGLFLSAAGLVSATDLQGVIADWRCVKPMVKRGRENTLRNDRSCSMMKNYNRDAYGLITDSKKYYRLDDPGNAKIKQILQNTPDKDNLRVIVTGELQGNTVRVQNISLL